MIVRPTIMKMAPPPHAGRILAGYHPNPCHFDRAKRAENSPERGNSRSPLRESRRFRTSGDVFLPPLRRVGHKANPSSLQSEKQAHAPNLGAIAEDRLRLTSAGYRGGLQHPKSALIRSRSSDARRASSPRILRVSPGPLSLRASTAKRDSQPSCALARNLIASRASRYEALRDSGAPTVTFNRITSEAFVVRASRLHHN